MRITTITIGYGRTEALPDYCNVKPSVSLTAELGDNDNIDLVIEELLDQVESIVNEAADQALEAAGRPAKYSTEPRYNLLVSCPVWVPDPVKGQVKVKPPENLIIIVPDGAIPQPRYHDPAHWLVAAAGESAGLRFAHAHKRALEIARAETAASIIDASIDQGGIPAWALEPPAETIARMGAEGVMLFE